MKNPWLRLNKRTRLIILLVLHLIAAFILFILLIITVGFTLGAVFTQEADAAPEPAPLRLASTTSTRDSGLLEHLLRRFKAETGIGVQVIAVGTGRALEHGRRGDVDVLLVHDSRSEQAFVAEGYAPYRREVMYNSFLIAGPRADPAGAARCESAACAFARIALRRAPFVSRGDQSGTHKAELRLWRAAGIQPDAAAPWYRESGGGMGAALNIARELGAYILVDRGTWLSQRPRGALLPLFEGDPALHNRYGVLPVSQKRHPHVNAAGAKRLVEWLLSAAGQGAIESFRVRGRQLFFAQRAPDTK